MTLAHVGLGEGRARTERQISRGLGIRLVEPCFVKTIGSGKCALVNPAVNAKAAVARVYESALA